MGKLGRRDFLGGAGLLAGLAAGCRGGRDPYALDKPPVSVRSSVRAFDEERVLSTCGLCLAACGISVRVVGGRAVKIEGNSASRVNRGGLCARGQAGLEFLYNPERMRSPMRRVGGRASGRWQSIAWEEAIALLVLELDKLRAARVPQALVLLDGEPNGFTHMLWARFMAAFGSPNHIGHGAASYGAVTQAVRLVAGTSDLPGYDFEHARSVLVVGTGPLESSSLWMPLARALGGNGDSRPRMLCAAPRLPQSAIPVDAWLAIAPGSAVIFLLGLMSVLLSEHLGDEAQLETVPGFASWVDGEGTEQRGFRTVVIEDFSPAKVETRTGIPATRLIELARELATSRPSVVVADEGTGDYAGAVAAVLLNGLLSAVNRPGGMQVAVGSNLAAFPALRSDSIASAGCAAARVDGLDPVGATFEASCILALPEALQTGRPYPVQVALLHYSNPIFSKPGRAQWQEALAKVPFVVSFSPVFDESVQAADLVLPDPSYLERWDLVFPGRGARTLSLRQPVVQPIGNTQAVGEVILRLAKGLGGTMTAALPWPNYRTAVASALAGVQGGLDEVLSEATRSGTWEADPSQEASRPRELAARRRNAESDRAKALALLGGFARMPWPTFGDPVRFPFLLVPFRGLGYAEGGIRHLPWLAELPLASGDPWRERIEIALEDAHRLGIEDGERVLVESSVAKVELHALVRTGIVAGALGLPLGGGPTARETSPSAASLLLGPTSTPVPGQAWPQITRAQIGKLS